MKQFLPEIIGVLGAVFGFIGKIAWDKTTKRKREIDLYEQMEKAVQQAQDDISELRERQHKQFDAMTQILLEKQELEIKVKALQDENTRLKATIKRLQSKLNAYIKNHQ